MALRRPDVCVVGGIALNVVTRAEWNPKLKVGHLHGLRGEGRSPTAPEQPSAEPSPPSPCGALRGLGKAKYDKLHTQREEQAKQKLGRRIGGVYLALSNEPQSTRAWGIGSRGERLWAVPGVAPR